MGGQGRPLGLTDQPVPEREIPQSPNTIGRKRSCY
jgi:hypothetical protein